MKEGVFVPLIIIMISSMSERHQLMINVRREH